MVESNDKQAKDEAIIAAIQDFYKDWDVSQKWKKVDG